MSLYIGRVKSKHSNRAFQHRGFQDTYSGASVMNREIVQGYLEYRGGALDLGGEEGQERWPAQ